MEWLWAIFCLVVVAILTPRSRRRRNEAGKYVAEDFPEFLEIGGRRITRAEVKMKSWLVISGEIRQWVSASNQYEAWDCLKEFSAEQFGAIATAEPNESDNPFIIRTSVLLFHWGRDQDARRWIERMMEEGSPDTEFEDRQAAVAF